MKLIFCTTLSQLMSFNNIYLYYTVLWSVNTIGPDVTMADYRVQLHDYGVLPATTELSRSTITNYRT